ncbi:unnamed protein product [Polarella glacialis]|uniref:RING-type domain-containing protein n=1 Tax=Polarella glacialis TaxID=89957 RepID=A0A813LHD6_POLGL|nr:unnamed protein product [Polarella glacialis]
MGCAASTQGVQTQYGLVQVQSSGTRPTPSSHAHQSQQQQQVRPVPGPGPGPQDGSLATAPLVRSLVSLHRDSLALEKDEQGYHLTFRFGALTAGTATASFVVSGGDEATDGAGLVAPIGVQASTECRFEAGTGQTQTGRLFLCSDLAASLQGLAGDKSKHHAMLDLRADDSDPKAVTAQRSFLKLSADGNGEVQVEKQLVQCGVLVRQLDALYGTMPNPRAGNSEADGGDCVICLSNPREVAILHCRHVCLCLTCAQITSSTWSFQCPVCRGRVAAMVGLKDA